MIDSPAVGDRVSFEDAANPRRFGVITDRHDDQWRVRWDAAHGGQPETWSDLRQHGWRREKRQYRVMILLEADNREDLDALIGAMLVPAMQAGVYYWHEVDETDEMSSREPGWLKRLRGESDSQ